MKKAPIVNPITAGLPFIATVVATEGAIKDCLRDHPDLPQGVRVLLEMKLYQLKEAWNAYQKAADEFEQTLGDAVPPLPEAVRLMKEVLAGEAEAKQQQLAA